MAVLLVLTLSSFGGAGRKTERTELVVFAAASMQETLEEIGADYTARHQDVSIVFNFDSSGTLKTQIQEGADCDIFISAGQKQMDQLESDGLVMEGTRANVVNNQVVVVTRKDSGTEIFAQQGVGQQLGAGTWLKVFFQQEAEAAVIIGAQTADQPFGATELGAGHMPYFSHCRTPACSCFSFHRPPTPPWRRMFCLSAGTSSQ